MKISIDTGELNQRITFQKYSDNSDGIGNQIPETTESYYSCWSYVHGLSGREYWSARESHEENTLSFKVRFCRKLAKINKTDYFIEYKGKIYDITDINNLQAKDSILIIKATERT